MAEIACGPINASQVLQEIPFICSLFANGGGPDIGVMLGVGCNTQNNNLWTEVKIPTPSLPEWINGNIQASIYEPGECDIFIFDGSRLTAHLCHEADIHIQTADPATIRHCVERWLSMMYRVLRTDDVSSVRKNWREIQSVAEALAGM